MTDAPCYNQFDKSGFTWRLFKMKQAIISTIIVLICGYFGCFLDIAGCIMATVGSATGCIVYAVTANKKSD